MSLICKIGTHQKTFKEKFPTNKSRGQNHIFLQSNVICLNHPKTKVMKTIIRSGGGLEVVAVIFLLFHCCSNVPTRWKISVESYSCKQ